MLFWILAGLLAAATVLGFMLAGRQPPEHAAEDASLAIYKDQMAEVARDLEQGLIRSEEAEGQKAEIGRRLLSARKTAGAGAPQSHRAVPMVAVLLVPALAFAIYGFRGAPGQPDVPRAQRMAMAQQTGDVDALLAQVEDHLAANPGDATGWKLLVPSYMSMGRFSDAAQAITIVLQLEAPTAELYAQLAEALTLANQGLLTDAAEAAVSEALKLDGTNPVALYYEALALSQKGRRTEALAKFRHLLATTPADAPWRSFVEEQVNGLGATAPALTDEQIKEVEAQAPAPEDRMAMIRGMVDGLESRLAGNGSDLEGWLRLIRARSVLNEQDKAREAVVRAKALFTSDAAAMRSIDALARELNL